MASTQSSRPSFSHAQEDKNVSTATSNDLLKRQCSQSSFCSPFEDEHRLLSLSWRCEVTLLLPSVRPTNERRCTASIAFGQKTVCLRVDRTEDDTRKCLILARVETPFEGLYEEGRRESDEAVVYGVWPYPAQVEWRRSFFFCLRGCGSLTVCSYNDRRSLDCLKCTRTLSTFDPSCWSEAVVEWQKEIRKKVQKVPTPGLEPGTYRLQ
ncbi:hypothetical protein PROFUN_10892 [Planoprotostelium fungivorum]|uniref:Uncharacterized protein n=1 Tax=Planoprotostelium fungivorum TaxID=1890364 RepID=A0A2P6NC58_9EUKA|nr:hypothetical protein PROFUN_10892 [Planoprotostelium fungivorum]